MIGKVLSLIFDYFDKPGYTKQEEEYLSRATDLSDLERRQRELMRKKTRGLV